ncbi:hypothetical protein [Modestobacter sp. SSW1-42]|uniref:hypothetical protein n=1 Tax=Modestobacter sp. SSW1-42 TaxID=596372 RepID=UPI00398731EF
MTGTLTRGLLAGAAGTTALTAATYLDMTYRGRPASTVPEQTVQALLAATGQRLTGSGTEKASRATGLGALLGIANGLTVGVVSSVVRSAGVRMPFPVGTVVKGAASMATTDVPVALLGVSDPRTWSREDWLADALPHLAYGAAVQAVVQSLPTPKERVLPRQKASADLVRRSLLLGIATGSRSSLGLAAPTLTAADTGALKKLASLTSLGGELYADKQPSTPDRTSGAGLPPRLASGATGAGLLARRQGANAAWPVVAGMVGSAAGSFGGLAWRQWASTRMPALRAGLIEDGVALTLAAVACLPGRRRSTRLTLVKPLD